MQSKPSLDHIKRHLEFISRPRDAFQNPETLKEIQIYLENEFRSYGYGIEKHAFEFQGETFENVIAHLDAGQTPGSAPPFIVAAHFDAVPGTPGADDNASGVAAMLEAARMFSGTVPKEDCLLSVQFIAFNLEEYGMVGSTEYVKACVGATQRVARTVQGMISLEMVGYTSDKKGSQKLPLFLKPFYPDTGNFLALVGDGNSKELLKMAKQAFSNAQTLTVPGKGMLIPETRLSDHSPFWDANIPALLVTDTSFFRNPYYHTPQDTIETLNLDFLQKTTEGVVNFCRNL